jgi:hypothetical protein
MTNLLARIGRTALVAMCLIFLGSSAAHARWVSSDSSKPVPQGAVKSGTEQNNINAGVNLYVCRVAFQGGVHPGKLIDSSWRRCNFGWGGDEWYSLSYEVLIDNGTWNTGSPSGALIGGHEADGAPLYICRATVTVDGIDHGTASGKLVGNIGAQVCSIGYGGAERTFSPYMLFYETPEVKPTPTFGNVDAFIVIDVYNGPNCGTGRFWLEGQPQEVSGQYSAGSYPGFGHCSYRAFFTNVNPGRYRVIFDGYNACDSTTVTAGNVSYVNLAPNRWYC